MGRGDRFPTVLRVATAMALPLLLVAHVRAERALDERLRLRLAARRSGGGKFERLAVLAVVREHRAQLIERGIA